MMDPRKEETIANLYSLRAGMSFLSLHNDILKQMKKEIVQPQEENLAEIQKTYDECMQQGEAFRSAELEDKVKNRDQLINNVRKEYQLTRKRFWWLLICIPITIFSILIFGLLGVMGSFIVSIVLLGVLLVRDKNDKEKANNSIKEFADACDKYQYACNQFEKAKKGCEAAIREQKREVEEAWQKYANRANLFFDNYRTTYGVLKSYYSDTLLVNDWQNLDIIIYYLATGRVDTLKEALQAIDKFNKEHRSGGRFSDRTLGEVHSVIKKDITNSFASTDNKNYQRIADLSNQLKVNNVQSIQSLKSGKEFSRIEPSDLQSSCVSATDLCSALKSKREDFSVSLFAEMEEIQGEAIEISNNCPREKA